MGVAVVCTLYVLWCCQLDNVLVCQLCFAVCDLTISISLPGCSHLQVEDCPCGKAVGSTGSNVHICVYTRSL